MRKKIIALILGACMVTSVSACGTGGKRSTEEATEATETAGGVSGEADQTSGDSGGTTGEAHTMQTILPDVASANIELDVSKLVTKLCDYKNVPVTITGDYEVDEENLHSLILADLEACYADLEEVTDREIVEKDDVVKVDYTGYLNGVAFDNGSAQGAYVKVGNGNGYIDGFTDGLEGAKVGDEIESKVTFPEDYGKEELNGQETTFKFKIYGIYKQITDFDTLAEMAKDEDSLVNTNVSAVFGSYGITDFQSLVDYETSYVERSLESKKYSDTVSAIKDYMLENSEAEVPEDYLDARVAEYQYSYEEKNVTGSQTLEEYLSSSYGTTLEEAQESWRENALEQIKAEMIFGRIAEIEKLEYDETEFENFVNNVVSSSSASLAFGSTDELYEYYGAGNAENGKKYMEKLYLMNKAVDLVYEAADVTVEEAAETESTESMEGTENS